MSFTERSEQLLGAEAIAILQKAHVAVFGLGGVGSWAAEALARTGVGSLSLIDGDVVEESNLNRQLPALVTTIGQSKVQVLAERLAQINPALRLHLFPEWYLPGASAHLLSAPERQPLDYVLDAIDDLPAKIDLILACHAAQIPLLSAGGCGRRFEPSKLVVCDLYTTAGDPFLRNLRQALRKRGLPAHQVVYSTELPWPKREDSPQTGPASLPFVPATAGLMMATECVRHLCQLPKKN